MRRGISAMLVAIPAMLAVPTVADAASLLNCHRPDFTDPLYKRGCTAQNFSKLAVEQRVPDGRDHVNTGKKHGGALGAKTSVTGSTVGGILSGVSRVLGSQ